MARTGTHTYCTCPECGEMVISQCGCMVCIDKGKPRRFLASA